jgi:hypothetical protein
MNAARDNAAWAGCGGPTVRQATFDREGWTIRADRDARLSAHPCREGEYRPRGQLWFATEAGARAWLARMYPGLYPVSE